MKMLEETLSEYYLCNFNDAVQIEGEPKKQSNVNKNVNKLSNRFAG